MQLQWIDAQHPLYQGERALRLEVLRKPIGMTRLEVKPQELLCQHLVLVDGDKVQGCLMLHHREGIGRLLQMAVKPDLQRQGWGKKIVAGCEQRARELGLTRLDLHARHTAVEFYKKLGFVVVGEAFTEVGMEHFLMHKNL